jgi:lysophospholipase L1-like esterase
MMMMGTGRLVAAGAAVLLLAGLGGTAGADVKEPLSKACVVPDWVTETDLALPNAKAQFEAAHGLKIVALGSSSTLGSGGSGPAAAWPARLEAELRQRLPQARVTVVNKGLMQQSVPQMLARLEKDVIAERPALVIWEAGTSEAVRGVEIDTFTTELLAGIDRLLERDIDVVLMDMQYAKNTARLINFQPYVDAVERTAAMRDVFVFPRYGIMRDWVEHEQVHFGEQTPRETVATADQVYACLAKYLAVLIAHGLSGT